MPRWRLLLVPLLLVAARAGAQTSLAPLSPRGQTITPVFEGWYRNRDGTYSLSFGYFNRNAEEIVEVPVGPDNALSPGSPDQGQPTVFHPRRHWGVFAVVVPADFGDKKVTWTLRLRGETVAIPGSLKADWQIDALEGEASADDTPPTLTFPGGASGQGPLGATAAPLSAKVGVPLRLTVDVTDDAKTFTLGPRASRRPIPVSLAWFKHQGPGAVTFGTPQARLEPNGGRGETTVTFGTPGEYVVRVRAIDQAVSTAGHAQCCWTNGFVKVTVTP